MPVVVNCPACQQPMQVPDELLTHTLRCPRCKATFAAMTPSAPAPPPEVVEVAPVVEKQSVGAPRRQRDEADKPRGRPARRDDDEDEDDDLEGPSPRQVRRAWRIVRMGVNLILMGTWTWLAGFAVFVCGMLIGVLCQATALEAVRADARESARFIVVALEFLFPVMVGLFCLCQLAELALRVVGSGLCLAVPSRPGDPTKPLAIGAFAVNFCAAALYLVGLLSTFADNSAWSWANLVPLALRPDDLLWQLGVFGGLAGCVVFLLFCRSAALQLRDRILGNTFMVLLIAFCVWYVVAFGAFVLDAGARQVILTADVSAGRLVVYGIFYLIAAGTYMGLVGWYIRALARLRTATSNAR
jgi:hypothetical protein